MKRVCIVLSLMCVLVSVGGDLQRFEQPPKSNGTLSFLVVGDWGRKGAFNQSQVAFQMGRIGEELDADFVISTGDNFYDNGLTSQRDLAFHQSFTNIYTANSLQKQWYIVLGNHDYRGNVEAQLSPHLRNIDSRWLCLRSFIVNAELAEIFLVDTTPFVDAYFTNPEGHHYDWHGIYPRKSYVANFVKDLELALKKSNATWKIVVGHHAIRSIGHHGDTQELIDDLLPVLKANNVDFYMNGHDHCLQHISDADAKSKIHYLTSGAGSKAWRGDVKETNKGRVKFFYDGPGFMSAQLTHTQAHVAFYDVFGNVLHTWATSKLLYQPT